MLSGVAAFYSVTGLAYIFTSVFWPIVIMGAILEAAKLAAASWIYRSWRFAPKILVTYLSVGVLLLMIITDIGIFGYLSRAYLEQQAPLTLLASNNAAAGRDADLAREQYERDDAALAAFIEGDTANAVIEELTAYARLTGANGAVEVLRSQNEIQRELQANLQVSSAALSAAERAVAEVEQETQVQRVDVGPLLFVAKAYYGNEDLSTIDTVVTAFILVILVVFDPMAIALLLAAQTASKVKVPAETTGDGWGGDSGEGRTLAYTPDADETLSAEEVEPPRVSKDHKSPVVSIMTEDLGTGIRIGVPAQHAYKSGTAHATEANDDSESADTVAAKPILPTNTDTDTPANHNLDFENLDDTAFVVGRPKSGKRRTRHVPKN